MNLNSGAIVRNDGTFDAQASGYMFGSPGAFINAGTLRVTNPTVYTTFYVPVTNRGNLVLSGAWLRGLFGFTQTAGRMVLENAQLNADGGLRLLGGSLSGDGTINAPYFFNRGDIVPGRPLGTLRLMGNAFTNFGHLYVDLQSAPGPPVSDLLQLPYAHAQLGGTLHVCYNGFVGSVPVIAFTILSAASLSGNFTRMDGLELGGGSVLVPRLVPVQSPGSFTLVTSNGLRRDGVIGLVGCGEGLYQVRFTGAPATPYQIDGAVDLGDWTTLVTSNSSSGVMYYLDTDAPALPRRFYRARRTH